MSDFYLIIDNAAAEVRGSPLPPHHSFWYCIICGEVFAKRIAHAEGVGFDYYPSTCRFCYADHPWAGFTFYFPAEILRGFRHPVLDVADFKFLSEIFLNEYAKQRAATSGPTHPDGEAAPSGDPRSESPPHGR